MLGEIFRLAAEHGWWVLVPFIVLILARSRPGHEVGRVVAKEVRWRYLKAKGYSDEELRRMVLDDWTDEPKAVKDAKKVATPFNDQAPPADSGQDGPPESPGNDTTR